MTETKTPRFRHLGVTDERVECDACGKTELRSTVVLAALDAEGNDDGVVYYGSTCAARALGRPARDGAKVLAIARGAHERLRAEARNSLDFLAFVGLDVQGRPMFVRDGERRWGPAARRYGLANPVVFRDGRPDAAVVAVKAAAARHAAIVADGIRMGVV